MNNIENIINNVSDCDNAASDVTLERNVETFIGCDSDYEAAKIVLFGAPFDSTTSFRPGARFGSAAIRHESFGIETYSPYQDKDLEDCQVFDSGDIELCFGDAGKALSDIQNRAGIILDGGRLPVMLGGEHLVTLGAFRAAFKKYPDLHIIHFDAHADLRDDYLGARLSHACVIRRCYELIAGESGGVSIENITEGRDLSIENSAEGGESHNENKNALDRRIHQFCIRSGERAEFEFAKKHTDMHRFNFDVLDELVDELVKSNTPVYFTIDLDCMDPSIFPGTGTPEAGGVSFSELLQAVLKVCRTNVVAADINELAPMLDASGTSTAAACKLLRELILALYK